MEGLTDRDIAYDMLFGAKQRAAAYCWAALEAATPSCHRVFMELCGRELELQHRIWEYLHRREEYRVREVPPQELDEVRGRMERLRDNLVRDGETWSGRQGAFAGAGTYQNQGGYQTGYQAGYPSGQQGGYQSGGAWNQGGYQTGYQSGPQAGYQGGGAWNQGGYQSPGAVPGSGSGFRGSDWSAPASRGSSWDAGNGGRRADERRFETTPRY